MKIEKLPDDGIPGFQVLLTSISLSGSERIRILGVSWR